MLRSRTSVASLIDLNNPSVCALGRAFGGVLPGRTVRVPGVAFDEGDKKLSATDRRGVHIRTDVVSEQLCDDVLEYLAPTLEAYKGCTVIDMNPGACLWSRKLHDFLRPKRHLLMEPEERYHDLFIKPLLQTSGSTYRLTTLSGSAPRGLRKSLEEALHGDLLPHKPRVEAGDPALRQVDTNLLVTGNLARRQHGDITASIASHAGPNYTLAQLNWASLANELFHRGGLVRMLYWTPDMYRMQIIPERVVYPSQYNINTQLCANVSEVAGVKQNSHYRPDYRPNAERHPDLKAHSACRVRERMHQAGMEVPEGRALRIDPESGLSKEQMMISPLTIRSNTVGTVYQDLEACKASLTEVCDALDVAYGVKNAKALLPLLDRLEYPQSLRMVLNHENSSLSMDTLTKQKAENDEPPGISPGHQRAAIVLDLRLRIINLETHCKVLEESGADVEDLKSKVIALDRDLRRRLTRSPMMKQFLQVVETLLADQLSLFCSPPALTLDRRQYEPLQASSDDFWPRTELCLLDVVPQSRDLSVPGLADRTEGVRMAQELTSALFNYRIQPVPWVLDKIAPNAAQDLIPKVPSLTDPRKGGRLNVDTLQIRNLTDEMIEGLTKAWIEWPFKPDRAQIALDFDSSGGESAEEGEHRMEDDELEL